MLGCFGRQGASLQREGEREKMEKMEKEESVVIDDEMRALCRAIDSDARPAREEIDTGYDGTCVNHSCSKKGLQPADLHMPRSHGHQLLTMLCCDMLRLS